MPKVGAKTKAVYVRSPKMVIRSSSGRRLTVPFAPKVVEAEQDGIEWTESARPGKKPVLRFAARKSRRLTMTLTFYNKNRLSVYPSARTLFLMARSDGHITMSYSQMESGAIWKITDINFSSLARNINNAPYHMEVTMTVQEVTREAAVPGPVSASRSKSRPPTKKKGGGRTYRVKRGDTLWDISAKYYGSGLKWRRIADANNVRDPRKLQIGKVLRIP